MREPEGDGVLGNVGAHSWTVQGWTIPEIPKNSLSNNSERMGSLLIIETRFPVPFPSPNYQEPFQQLGS